MNHTDFGEIVRDRELDVSFTMELPTTHSLSIGLLPLSTGPTLAPSEPNVPSIVPTQSPTSSPTEHLRVSVTAGLPVSLMSNETEVIDAVKEAVLQFIEPSSNITILSEYKTIFAVTSQNVSYYI